MKRTIIAALVCAGAAVAFAQGGSVVLPSREQIREYSKEIAPRKESATGECARCGVVTSIEALGPQPVGARPALIPQAEIHDQDVQSQGTLPVLTRDARAARKEMSAAPGERFRVHVRHDDGSYSSHDMDRRPAFSNGDRVEVTLDGVRPR